MSYLGVAYQKHLGAFAVDFVLAVYFLLYKKKIVGGGKRLFQDLMSETMYVKFSAFLKRCDGIFIKYLICEVLDALIVGAANAVFMLIFRMEYVPSGFCRCGSN